MELEWKLFADLKEYAGSSRVTVEVDEDATVGDALSALVTANPGLDGRVFDENGTVYDHVNVLRNGENVETAGDGLETELEEADELALFPPVSGG
ncbi:molybdopterin synthase sulfur carrier subunit [Salinigranum rubrum]|uniref:Molybdopterin synthase sulfur carrier subunit n=1 Tax=Salinigranum rubrum TaxID=755307 RepID=A0A2I8VM76_9EURY|nr:ubiquitin-like small modifier protein 1 [Salinigranum rubrum]AUV82984.1 molybdopterin synthase sulfur carrier subunit [Salinigranum rubrum]